MVSRSPLNCSLPLGFSLCLLAAWAAGCGAKADPVALARRASLVPVTGTVTLDAKPLAGVTVTYLVAPQSTGGETASGFTDTEGCYALSTYLPGVGQGISPGATPGEYKVIITKLVLPNGNPVPPETTDADAEAEGARQLLSSRYSNPERTTLSATVSVDSSTHNFALKSKP